jgi:hypothetical protein
MSSVESFEINLEHDIDEQYQYEPGEVLRGHVLLVLSLGIKVKAVQVQLKGEATVSWEEKGTTYRADETYIDVTQNLVQAETGESLSLEKGKHRFPLEYTLPLNLPSSFIGKFGSITYVVKATLKEDKKFGLSTLITSEPFLVLRKLDLTREPQLLEPYKIQEVKRFWGALAFCVSGKVNVTLNVNKTGHLPGEDIFMDAEIANDSPRIVKAVQASIIMHSTFHAKNNVRYNTQIVNKKRDEWEMSYGEGRRWKGVRLTIPPYIPESRLDGCDIIDIQYELLFRAEISGGNELRIVIPVTVGTMQGQDSDANPRKYKSVNDKEPSPTKEVNGNHPENGENGVDEEDVDYELDDEEHQRFRYPMEPGDTRNNPIFDKQ